MRIPGNQRVLPFTSTSLIAVVLLVVVCPISAKAWGTARYPYYFYSNRGTSSSTAPSYSSSSNYSYSSAPTYRMPPARFSWEDHPTRLSSQDVEIKPIVLWTPLKIGISETRILESCADRRTLAPTLIDEFHKADLQLVELHAQNRIGSFDIDSFSQQLLAIKRNYHEATAASTQPASPKRAQAIRQELKEFFKQLDKCKSK